MSERDRRRAFHKLSSTDKNKLRAAGLSPKNEYRYSHNDPTSGRAVFDHEDEYWRPEDERGCVPGYNQSGTWVGY